VTPLPYPTRKDGHFDGVVGRASGLDDRTLDLNNCIGGSNMTPLQGTAAGFVALLIAFLIVAYFTQERQGASHGQILKFLCSLCAGFAGGLITGEALFKFDTQIDLRAQAQVASAETETPPRVWQFRQSAVVSVKEWPR